MFARGVYAGSHIRTEFPLAVGIACVDELRVAATVSKIVEVPIPEPAPPLLNMSSALVLSSFTEATAFVSIARASTAVPSVC